MAKHLNSTPGSSPLPLTLVDLDRHPDGELMRLCSQAGRLRDRAYLDGIDVYQCPGPDYVPSLHRLIGKISDMPAKTIEGFKLKALCLLGGEDDPHNQHVARAPLVSVVKDALRLGLPA